MQGTSKRRAEAETSIKKTATKSGVINMSCRPNSYMKMYWGDYFADTRHLSTVEHGAYLLMIAHYWRTGVPLPDDDLQLQRITGLRGNIWKEKKPILARFFRIADGLWHHKRIDAELKKSTENYEKKVLAGKQKNNSLPYMKTQECGDAKNSQVIENKENTSSICLADASQPEPEPDTYINISSEKEKYIKRKNPENELVERGLKIFNAVVEKYGGQVCKILNPAKKSRLLRRISDAGGIETFETILTEAVEKSQFLQGKIPPREGHNQFRLSMKFICQEDSFNNILNGVYNDKEPSNRVSEKGNFQPNKPASIANAIARSVSHGTIREGGYFSGQRIQI